MNSFTDTYTGDRPYKEYDEYLQDLAIYAAGCLRNYLIHSFRSAQDKLLQEGSCLPEYEEVLSILDTELHGRKIMNEQELNSWYHLITGRRGLTEIINPVYPIDSIVSKLGLEETAVSIILLALLGSVNKKYQKVFQFLNRDPGIKHPTLELCARVFHNEDITEYALYHVINVNMREYKLIFPELSSADHPMLSELICDERLQNYLMKTEGYLNKGVEIIDTEQEIDPILYRENELLQLNNFIGSKEYPVFLICGDKGSGKKHLLYHYLKQNHSSVVLLNLKNVASEAELNLDTILGPLNYVVRECVLQTLPLAIVGVELLKQEDFKQLMEYINNRIKKTAQLIFLLLEKEHFSSSIEGLYIMELSQFNELQRIELWRYYIRNYQLVQSMEDCPVGDTDRNVCLEELANTFIITPGQMIGAIRQASLFSGGNTKPIREKLLYKACYAQLNHKLAEKTSKVNAGFHWDDLKMSASDKELLRDICNCVKNKHIVMNEWNFSKVVPYGAGLTVLFAGPPGTGKTMAAQVIANELNMELYKIDLSQIFDKYVGETEKNIKNIFDQAKKSNSILFFDEADAIFNKRVEASSANDRFANIESSLLLQCVEEYSGISILATNNFNAMDSAFIRRFKYYLLFREPDENVRYEIWKSIIPEEAPVSNDVDLKALAHQFELTGAVIKNVILAAAYLAAAAGRPISLLDILKSLKRELFKNNLTLTKDKLGSLGYLFDDID